MVVNERLKKIHAHLFIEPLDLLQSVKSSQRVSGCVNALSQYSYEKNNISESVLSSVVKKLTRELKNKWMKHVLRYDSHNKNMRVFSASLKERAHVQENLCWQFGHKVDKSNPPFTKNQPKNTCFQATSYSGSPTKSKCPSTDREHKMWPSEKFKKMNIADRHEVVRKCNLVFSCLGSGHKIGQCKANRFCAKDGCSKRHTIFLHGNEKKPNTRKETNNNNETAHNADAVLTAN